MHTYPYFTIGYNTSSSRRLTDGEAFVTGIQLLEYTFQYHEHPETMRQMIELIKTYLEAFNEKQTHFIDSLLKNI